MNGPDLGPDLSDENEAVLDMVEWFLARYEDPAENCPRDDGEFVFIYGGPFLAAERIRDAAIDAGLGRVADSVNQKEHTARLLTTSHTIAASR